ncbi:MAG TPA: LexA family transcriptional regulator [Candidatus Angelobacter sp.]|nr:LexA family transcriptional regulator [Candidatus Angelobacter sp.]
MPQKGSNELAERTKALREAKGLTQAELGRKCGVDQGAVAKWEAGKLQPNGRAIGVLAALAGDPDKWWWLEQIGINRSILGVPVDPSDIVEVPLFKDRISAGPGWIMDERNIDGFLKLPRDWVPHARHVRAAKVVGDSMSPIIQSGFTVLIDTADRDHKLLLRKMVAAREGDEITIKWLRQEGKFYQLVPEHPTDRNRVRILTADKDVAIIGRIIMWIGSPDQYK